MDAHANSKDTINQSYFTEFKADWKVPKLPTKFDFQVIYFWPGFKS